MAQKKSDDDYYKQQKKIEEQQKMLASLQGKYDSLNKSISENSGTPTVNSDGSLRIESGQNMYGFTRPDYQLMRNKDNQIAEPFRENVGSSINKLKEYGNTLGSDVDQRAKLQMGDAFGKLKQDAMSTGDMESIAIARQRANNKSLADAGNFNRQNANNLSSMQSQLAMRGGVGGGASERMARQSMRNHMMGQQGIAAQNRDANLELSLNNANMKQNLLRDVGQVEQTNNQYNANAFTNNQNRQLDALTRAGQVEQDVQRSNILAAREDLGNQNTYSQRLYESDMAAWGAKQTADAQRKAGSGGGGGGCCFIFLEARYGNGTMDKVVRRFRDEHMTDKNKRGYYKLSEVLVPMMRKHKLVKAAVRLLMTDPMVAYGKAYYGENKLGFIFKPVVKFWLNTFDFLGGDHEFIRENGEVI
jgi:hypothetical protein